MAKKIFKIGIDARFYGPLGKGLGRYTQEVVDNILKLDTQNDYVIFLNKENFSYFKTDNKRVKKVLADVRWYTLREQIVMPWLIFKEKIDLMHYPHFNVPIFAWTKFIVTIHDLILFRYPTARATTLSPLIYKLKNLAYRFVINIAVKKSLKVITVSEFTKQDILSEFNIPANKIIVIYEGVTNFDKKITKDISNLDWREKYSIVNKFFLYVGNAYPHKNLEQLLKTFAKFSAKEKDVQLVLVGKKDYFYNRLKEQAKKLNLWEDNSSGHNKVVFPGYVPDAELNFLYTEALAYIFPSLYEGFGLPPLEAMAKGCPVISSDKSSMPEVLGSAALYFNPKNSAEILKAMEEIKNNSILRQAQIKLGFKQAEKFNWQKCASETYKVYSQYVDNK